MAYEIKDYFKKIKEMDLTSNENQFIESWEAYSLNPPKFSKFGSGFQDLEWNNTKFKVNFRLYKGGSIHIKEIIGTYRVSNFKTIEEMFDTNVLYTVIKKLESDKLKFYSKFKITNNFYFNDETFSSKNIIHHIRNLKQAQDTLENIISKRYNEISNQASKLIEKAQQKS